MELRHLRYFVAVAEELHFSHAAERLHVSQPPLSQQIKQLEEEVQVRLFDRSKRWVRLTSAGRLFLEHARQVLMAVDGAVLAARQTVQGKCDRLSVACTPWAGYVAIPQILRRFNEEYCNVGIEIQTLNSVKQLHGLKARAIDVGFMWQGLVGEDFQIDIVASYPVVVALPFKHQLGQRARLAPRDLSGECYVALAGEVAPVYSQVAAGYWEKAGIAMKERHRVDRPDAVIELVAAGAGFALVPLPVHEYAERRIICRRLDPAPPPLELTLARVRGMESPAINALFSVALQIAEQRRSFFTGEDRAESCGDSPDLSAIGRLSQESRVASHPRCASTRRKIVATPRPSTDTGRWREVDSQNSGEQRRGVAQAS